MVGISPSLFTSRKALFVNAKRTLRLFDGLVKVNMPVERAMKKAVKAVELRAKKIITNENIIDTGTLRKSIAGIVAAITRDVVQGEISASTDYALYVHEGFRHYKSAKIIRARPFLTKALGIEFKNVVKILQDAMSSFQVTF